MSSAPVPEAPPTKPLPTNTPRCAECAEPASFRYTWPGQRRAETLCDRHMVAMAEHADPTKLSLEEIGEHRLIPVAIPGGEIEWRIAPR